MNKFISKPVFCLNYIYIDIFFKKKLNRVDMDGWYDSHHCFTQSWHKVGLQVKSDVNLVQLIMEAVTNLSNKFDSFFLEIDFFFFFFFFKFFEKVKKKK